MNKKLITLMAAALALLSASGQVNFTGTGAEEHHFISITPETSTGLNKIYVIYDTDGVSMTYRASTDEPVVWQSFDSRGGAYAEDIPGIKYDGSTSTLDQVLPNKGYIIYEGTRPFYCWVINYAEHEMSLNDMFFNSDLPCSLLTIRVDGIAHKIPYSTINGRAEVLDREITLSYNTLVWNDSTLWQESPVIETFESLDGGIQIDPPLCNTVFTLSGDRFLKEWDMEEVIESSSSFTTQAVKCGSLAYHLFGDDEKEKVDGDLSNASAPVHIVFTGYPTDAVVYRKWEIATDPDFENVILQYNQDEVDYTFNDAGNYYVRYMVANADGSCEDYGQTYQISVSESQLGKGARGDIPNVFSPGVQEKWKIPYKSIVEFHCWIFNRWGTLLYEYTDPDGGWDGTYHGRQVDTGVYYYVVTATGSDGVKYKKRGDINILLYKRGANGTSNGTGGETGF